MTPPFLTFPRRTWTPQERKGYEANVKWFHEAKYGIFVCVLATGNRAGDSTKNWYNKPTDWTSESWNQVIDAIDVEKFADQVKALGAGYVVLSLGQNHQYGCAPNPVIDKRWGLNPASSIPGAICRWICTRRLPNATSPSCSM